MQRLIQAFEDRTDASTVSRLDALMDIERLRHQRVMPFLLRVLADEQEPVQVRVHVLKRLRDRRLPNGLRERTASALLGLVLDLDGCPPQLHLQAVLALAEFTEIDGVPAALAALARDRAAPLDIRYSAFTSLERTGPTPESVALVKQLLPDDALGVSARSLLVSWQIENFS